MVDVEAITTSRRTLYGIFRPHLRAFNWGVLWLLCTSGLSLWIPRLLNQGVEGLRRGISTSEMMTTAGMLFLAALGMAFTRVWSRMNIFNVGRDIEYDLRRDLYAHLCAQPPEFFEQRAVGDLMSRATNDLSNIRLLLGFATLNIINTALTYVGNVPLLFRLDVNLAIAALIPYPIVLIAVRQVAKSVFSFTKVNQEDLGALQTRVQEHLGGLSVVRAFAQEEQELERFAVVNEKYYRSSIKLTFIRNLLTPVMALLGTSSALIALWYGGQRVLDGAITVGDLVEFNGRLALMAWPTLALGWILAVFQRGRASLERLNEVYTVEPSIRSAANPQEPQSLDGEVALDSVGVKRTVKQATGDAVRWPLKGIQLNLPARGFLGVVGTTGSGKTTLASLIPRMRDPSEGTIKLDGINLAARGLSTVREEVALAPQEAFLFSSSLLDNLRFGRPDASLDEVNRIVELLGLTHDLEQLPNGLQTVVGEKGITLSGGQRQRVALGRALLCEPKVLVLDDTVSAVDAETEEKILGALRDQAHKRTLVVISHRLSAVKDADEIIVLDAGVIVERGKHEELLRKAGTYAALWGRERALRDLEKMERGAAQERVA